MINSNFIKVASTTVPPPSLQLIDIMIHIPEIRCLLLFSKECFVISKKAQRKTMKDVSFYQLLTLDHLILEPAPLTLWRALSVYLRVSDGLCHAFKQWIHSWVQRVDTNQFRWKWSSSMASSPSSTSTSSLGLIHIKKFPVHKTFAISLKSNLFDCLFDPTSWYSLWFSWYSRWARQSSGPAALWLTPPAIKGLLPRRLAGEHLFFVIFFYTRYFISGT